MNLLENLNNNLKENKKVWISITGYRILLVFALLLERGRSVKELTDILETNKITAKSFSEDTVRLTIKTLRMAGCDISRPCSSNNFKYELLNMPFTLNSTEEVIDLIINLRNRYSQDINIEDIYILNNLLDKIMKLTENQVLIDKIHDSAPMENFKSLYKQLSNPNLVGKKVSVLYSSPKFDKEILDIIPQRVVYENGKLYLWCYVFKYQKFSILNVERILKINSVSIIKNSQFYDSYEVIYKLIGNALADFKQEINEEILEKTDDYIIVKANVNQEFWFVQRLLLFGSDFKIISPDFFKQKLIDKIKLIKKGYVND